MANVNLKTDFKDGEFLYADQLKNNFEAIQAALNAMNAIVWQDNADKVVTFRGTTEELMNRPIIDGQILYDTTTGESYIDYLGKRISTGSGNAIHIGETEPSNPSTQIWIASDELVSVGSEVVNSLEGNQERMAPSVAAVKNYIYGDILYEDTQGSIGNIELNDNVSNYSFIEIYFMDNNGRHNSTKIDSPNNKVALLFGAYIDHNALYMRVNQIRIADTSIIKEVYGQFNTEFTDLQDDSANFYIKKVVGYKYKESEE